VIEPLVFDGLRVVLKFCKLGEDGGYVVQLYCCEKGFHINFRFSKQELKLD
jgi:hypothetical protein